MFYFSNHLFFIFLFLSFCFYLFVSVFFKKNIIKEYALFSINLLFIIFLFQCQTILIVVLFLFSLLSFLCAYLIVKNFRFINGIHILCAMLFLGVHKYSYVKDFFGDLNQSLFKFYNPLGLIGLSYMCFKQIHFVYEVRSGLIKNLSFLRYLNYIFFFPTFISGPIDRYDRFSKDIEDSFQKKQDPELLLNSFFRISLGLAKKNFVVFLFSSYSLSNLDLTRTDLSFFKIILPIYCYTFLLYFDFSGYSDLAVGCSRLFRIQTPENFNSPFHAMTISDFWSRWHISLSEWIKSYIFFPILMFLNRFFKKKRPILFQSFAIFLTFFLSGIWHGDGKNFVVWGFFHGLALAVYTLYREYMKKNHKELYGSLKKNIFYQISSWALTFHFVVLNGIFFALKYDDALTVFKLLMTR